ncbi:MazG family protein [Quadrisphaera sp. GCM10027208]|uniref:MazG family protein n=1 Tax=Quadrisphaera sp. GCM10027208 TaxID=3273423 RepID=UPI00360CB937
MSRAVLVQATPRTPAGLLTAAGWDALRAAGTVRVHVPAGGTEPDPGWWQALADAGVDVVRETSLADVPGTWFDPAGDDALAGALARAAVAAGMELEVVLGAYDLPGARLLDLVAVMDRLRSPGGCPWDAQQTHESLLRYLVEEAYEVVEAVETGDRDHLVEELGDLLLQVVFHARVGAEHAEAPFTVDDVAAGIVAKLVRRHPHVFAGASAPTAEHVDARWEELKAQEKQRDSALDGVPPALPALARADKLVDRATRAGLPAPQPAALGGEGVGEHLLAVVVAARQHGVEPEGALREALRRYEAEVRAAERAAERAG